MALPNLPEAALGSFQIRPPACAVRRDRQRDGDGLGPKCRAALGRPLDPANVVALVDHNEIVLDLVAGYGHLLE